MYVMVSYAGPAGPGLIQVKGERNEPLDDHTIDDISPRAVEAWCAERHLVIDYETTEVSDDLRDVTDYYRAAMVD